jgi:DMSO/TMAO reductase YedYZ molybdopterin-dependent catalytic subunit
VRHVNDVGFHCGAHRRKEQNQIKRSIGCNWGPAATACTVWTGVPLRHVLAAAGVTKPEQGRRFVCFAGPKVRLPTLEATLRTVSDA